MKFKYYKGIRRLKHRVSGKNNNSSKSKASESLIFNTNAKLISEVTGNFITIMDALNLNYDKKHQIHPLLSKLVLNLNKVMGDFKENRQLLVDWLVFLNQMNSSDSISKEDGKKLLFDLETAYNKFYDLLE
ncbi:VPS28-domain-containing protein [Hanseniaspora valbyensis NRRL Y-1626]|uniref:VPS28-domain-containing protein n=1 Tax=Hanseniaspora valbyensis NRRL Y-1626 TaxID=766949 RepID=A0A1B7TH35_9ASCO|nr:VPS28-domain-containing protein [Hanseniaspora valbyensis NRRL Y-1626]